jgi:hypothetical protein
VATTDALKKKTKTAREAKERGEEKYQRVSVYMRIKRGRNALKIEGPRYGLNEMRRCDKHVGVPTSRR